MSDLTSLIDDMTFDDAQQNYRSDPANWEYEAAYAALAAEYYYDGMIGPDTFRAAMREIAGGGGDQ